MNRPAKLSQALISVVLPVYNEAHVLAELFARVSQGVADCGTRQEIIFVNDGSSDSSPAILDQLAAEHPQVRVIHFSRNFGHQAAVQAGLAHAQGDAVVLMDSDLQDSPEAIGRLVAEWITGYDVVYAVRRERPEALWKRCLFSGFHRLLSSVATTPIPTDAGNFSIIDGRVAREIVALAERDRYLPGLRSWVGFKQRGIEVRRLPRYDGRPRVSVGGLWQLAKTAIFSFSSLPLSMFYLIGYTALALFLGLGCYSLFCKLFTTMAVPGWTSTVLVASFFGSLNALGISILGEYVTRIYDQVRGRPLYLVERSQNLTGDASTPLTLPLTVAEGLVDQFAHEDDEYSHLLDEAEALAALTMPVVEAGPSVWTGVERRQANGRRTAKSSPNKVAKSSRKSGHRQTKKRGSE